MPGYLSSATTVVATKNMGNQLHSLCSYMAMFPASVPNLYISKFSKVGDAILDPFSGRGTAPLEACLLGRVGIGIDKSPLAYVLTKSKVQTPTKSAIIRRIYSLWKEFKSKQPPTPNEKWEIEMLFSNYTLSQLVFLKTSLNWKTNNIDGFITSMILGILHGSSEGYLSISMPNTFSMSPNYLKNYIYQHGLKKYKRDVFELLLKKLDRCYQKIPVKGKAYLSDARSIPRIADSSIDMVMTSPPYTRVIRYGEFNWIRLWFLGHNGKNLDQKLFHSGSLPKYQNFMEEVLSENFRVLKSGGKAVYVIGDVRKRDSENTVNLAQLIWETSAKKVGFDLFEPIREDRIKDSTKVSKIWGETKGRATKIDRILILEKP